MEGNEKRRSILFETFVLLSDDKATTAAHTVDQRPRKLLGTARVPSNGTAGLRPIPLVKALNALHEATRSDLTMSSDTPTR
ncbi:hypothetical protein GCM10010415_78640 [Streptomyces atrovirens]|uniref:Uncharacterized protein n=1 Tax=Streptomyces atrovirens TaxID=285556 RepID=A0ABW0E1V9_9ACTN